MYRKPSSWCFIENKKKVSEVNVVIDNIERVQSFNFLGITLTTVFRCFGIHLYF